MKLLLKCKKIIIFICAFVTTIGVSTNLINDDFIFSGNQFQWVIMLLILYVFFKYAAEKTNKRMLTVSRYLQFYNNMFFYIRIYGSKR